MTGDAALKVANAFARIHQQVSHKSLLYPSNLSFTISLPHNSCSNLSIFGRRMQFLERCPSCSLLIHDNLMTNVQYLSLKHVP